VPALRVAVERLRGELGGYEASLADRHVAERQLAALTALSAAGEPDGVALRDALLLVAAAVGSVSALVPALARLREAVEAFGVPHDRDGARDAVAWERVPAPRPAATP
jgi:hypothetical protein